MSGTRPEDGWPAGLSAPARRALAGAGYAGLDQLTRVSAPELLRLHGMGPRALEQLRRALAERGWKLADDA
ncbi:MAG: DNA-binding protein [Longimicrobiaceae bacterium]